MLDALLNEPEEDLRAAIEGALANHHTALPVRVLKDSDGKTVRIQPTVKATQLMPDGTTKLIDYPELEGLVHFASGGGSTFTHPIKSGDEGMVLFASRSIHNWREQGGTQPQVDARRGDLSDAMFIPGLRSKPRDLKNISTDAAQLRSDDGAHMVALHPKDGPSMSADNGKHTVAVNPKSGIDLKTTMALAVDAANGMSFKGAAHFADAVTSAKSFDAPGGSLGGGGLGGLVGGLVGALIGAGAMIALQAAQAPPAGPQQASYSLAMGPR